MYVVHYSPKRCLGLLKHANFMLVYPYLPCFSNYTVWRPSLIVKFCTINHSVVSFAKRPSWEYAITSLVRCVVLVSFFSFLCASLHCRLYYNVMLYKQHCQLLFRLPSLRAVFVPSRTAWKPISLSCSNVFEFHYCVLQHWLDPLVCNFSFLASKLNINLHRKCSHVGSEWVNEASS